MQEFLNRVIHGECSEIMAHMPGDYVDLTVTSPPYDNLRGYNGYLFPFEEIVKQLYRVTKQGGIVVWIVGDATLKGSETGTSFKQALYFKDIGFNLHDTMIYQKENPLPRQKNRYEQAFEYMFVLSKGKPKTTNLIRVPCKQAGRKRLGTARDNNRDSLIKNGESIVSKDKLKSNVWVINSSGYATTKDKIAFQHPAIFPERLAEDHILSWSNPGDVVLDCFCGSGTTLKMAKVNNRNFIGIDYSDEYVELSKQRLELVTA